MIGHHRHVRPPVFEAYEDTHANRVDAGLSHAVEAVHAPFEIRLHAARVVDFVIFAVIRLLKADDTIHAVARQFAVLLRAEGHDFDFQVAEIGLGQVERPCYVRYTCLRRVLARHEEEVLKRGKPFDGLVFIDHFFLGKDGTFHRVAGMETAVDATICARVCQVKGDKHGNSLAEAFERVSLAKAGHRLQIRFGSRRDESHKVFDIAVFAAKCTPDIGVGL